MNAHHKRYPGSLLSSGSLTAHERFSLVLLHSCPNTVQRFPLRKTKTSTPLTRGSFTVKHPGQNITPALAACRYRAPLTPRLCGLVKYTWKPWFCQVFLPFSAVFEKSSNKCKTLLAKHHFIILHNSICVLLVNLHRLPPLFVLLSAYSTLFMPVLPVLPGTIRRRFSIRTSPLGSR